MNDLTRQMFADAINAAADASPDEIFDTHDAEQRALRLHPVAVAREIIRCDGVQGRDALHQFSMEFGRYLSRVFGEEPSGSRQISRTNAGDANDGRVTTPNLAGDKVENQQWRRDVQSVVA